MLKWCDIARMERICVMPSRTAIGVLIAALSGAFMAAPATAAPPPGGIYSIIDAATLLPPKKGVVHPLPSQGAISTQALMLKGVNGLLIHLRWNAISTGVETYNWTALNDA